MVELDSLEYGVFAGADKFVAAPEKEPIIENFLYSRDTIMITAKPGVGKSILALQILASLTSGQPLFDSFKVNGKYRVLYVQTEGDRAETIERIGNMQEGIEFDHDMWVHANFDGVCLNEDAGYIKFLDQVRVPGVQYDVVIIDPLYTTVKGTLNSDDTATDWVRAARRMRKEFGCAFIIIHHDSVKSYTDERGNTIAKDGKDILGSTFWSAFINWNFRLTKDKNGNYILSCGKERNTKVIDRLMMRMEEPCPLMFSLTECLSESEAAIVGFMKQSSKPYYSEEVIKGANISRATFYRTSPKLIERNIISKNTESKRHTYSLI